jgi:hypothetical protein
MLEDIARYVSIEGENVLMIISTQNAYLTCYFLMFVLPSVARIYTYGACIDH